MLLNVPVRWWACPSCGITDRTQRPDVHTQFHPCGALGGVNIPLVEVQSPDQKPDGRQLIVEREDYIAGSGGDRIAAIRTERGDGSNDCTVFAETANLAATAIGS